jgi:O-Antigen ligase
MPNLPLQSCKSIRHLTFAAEYPQPLRKLCAVHVLVSLVFLSLLFFLARSSGFLIPLLIAASAVLMFGLLFAPNIFLLLAPLPFVLASMPLLDPGREFQIIRWGFLALLGLSLIVRTGMARPPRRWHPVYISLALFVALCLASIQYSSNGAMTLLKSLAFGFLLFVSIAHGALPREEGAAPVCSSFALLTVLVLLGCGFVAVRGGLTGPGGNFAGLFGDANSLGAFIGLAVPFLLFSMEPRVEPSPLKRAVSGSLFLAALVFLLASHSRAGIGAALLACGWWLFFSSRRAVTVLLVGGTVAALFVAVYFPSHFNWVEQQYILKKRGSVLQSREALWTKSLASVKENSFVGAGFGVSPGVSQGWQISAQTGKWGREKGNSYLAVAGEVGLIGALLLLLPVAWVLLRAARWLSERRRKDEKDFEFWTTLALSSCLIGGLTDAFAEAWLTAAGFFCTVIFWIAFGVLAARMTQRLHSRGR